jgi:putative DNA methylase
LWARTVPCPDPACGAEVPLLKTLWLCKKDNKRRALRLVPDPANRRVNFEIWSPDPDDDVPEGTMSGAKSYCPVCGITVTPDYIKECGNTGTLSVRMTTVRLCWA